MIDLRPQLRFHLQILRDPRDPHHAYLFDQLRQLAEPLRLSLEEFGWLEWFDGERSLRDIQSAAMRQKGGCLVPLERFIDLVRRLDEALLLEGPRWQRHIGNRICEPVCIGCYDGDPDRLRKQLHRLFTHRRGPGLPHGAKPDGRLCAALVPHIDYSRGGVSYAWGFKEVFEHTTASLFVIIGTSHYTTNRFTLTRKDFKTPLGVVRTDQDYIDRLVRHYGDGLFDDELLAHLPEHSIELEIVFLQYLYEGRRPIRIVPLVVGSFYDATLLRQTPEAFEDIGRLTEALRRTEAQTREPICYIISGDLAHLGPKFQRGRPPVTVSELDLSQRQDHALLERLKMADQGGFFRILADEKDARAICGFPPTYTVLEATHPGHGKLLHYDKYVHPAGFESVSFASVGFYR
jgi:AmmeMemoRadiSam system protein B